MNENYGFTNSYINNNNNLYFIRKLIYNVQFVNENKRILLLYLPYDILC